MRSSALALIAFAVSTAMGEGAEAQDLMPVTTLTYDIDHLEQYAAQVSWRFVHHERNRTLVCRGEGSAVFLGANRFLTAAHVVDQNPLTNDCAEFGRADLVLSFGPAELTGRVAGATQWSDEGGLTYTGGADLALIEVDARMIPLELRHSDIFALCPSEPSLRAVVRVATEYGVYDAKTEPRVNDEFARINLVGRGGHSGGGVFDLERRCLAGIVSNGGRNGTNYVATDAVRRFLARQAPLPGLAEAAH